MRMFRRKPLRKARSPAFEQAIRQKTASTRRAKKYKTLAFDEIIATMRQTTEKRRRDES